MCESLEVKESLDPKISFDVKESLDLINNMNNASMLAGMFSASHLSLTLL